MVIRSSNSAPDRHDSDSPSGDLQNQQRVQSASSSPPRRPSTVEPGRDEASSSRDTPHSVTSDSDWSTRSWTSTGGSDAREGSGSIDAAIQRLSLLATSIVSVEDARKTPQHSLLSRWPEERGVATTDYVSTVAEAQLKRSEAGRLRSERREARKAKRAEKYKILRANESQKLQSDPVFGRDSSPAESQRRAQEPRSESSYRRPVPSSSWSRMASSQERYPGRSDTIQGSSQTWSQSVLGSQVPRATKKSSKKRISGFR